MTSIFSKLFGKKKTPFRKTVELPKTAQDSIPFIEAYDNGLFLVDEDRYTLIFAFENIDYQLHFLSCQRKELCQVSKANGQRTL